MPYMVRALNDCPVYICKTVTETAEALERTVKLAKLAPAEAAIAAVVFGVHYSEPDAEPIELFGIRAEHLPEEDYEKWQKAF